MLTGVKPIINKNSYDREEYKAKCLLNLQSHQRMLDSLGELDALQEKVNSSMKAVYNFAI